MRSRSCIGVAAITESLLKRKWSLIVLRHLKSGRSNPPEIIFAEPFLTSKVLNDRLRTLSRYGLITRISRSSASSSVEYSLTELGEKMVEMMNTIDELDKNYQNMRTKSSRTNDEDLASEDQGSITAYGESGQNAVYT